VLVYWRRFAILICESASRPQCGFWMDDDQQVEDLSFWKSFIEYFIKKRGMTILFKELMPLKKEKGERSERSMSVEEFFTLFKS
jgi:hypothetical protein